MILAIDRTLAYLCAIRAFSGRVLLLASLSILVGMEDLPAAQSCKTVGEKVVFAQIGKNEYMAELGSDSDIFFNVRNNELEILGLESKITGKRKSLKLLEAILERFPQIERIKSSLMEDNGDIVSEFVEKGMFVEEAVKLTPAWRIRKRTGYTKILKFIPHYPVNLEVTKEKDPLSIFKRDKQGRYVVKGAFSWPSQGFQSIKMPILNSEQKKSLENLFKENTDRLSFLAGEVSNPALKIAIRSIETQLSKKYRRRLRVQLVEARRGSSKASFYFHRDGRYASGVKRDSYVPDDLKILWTPVGEPSWFALPKNFVYHPRSIELSNYFYKITNSIYFETGVFYNVERKSQDASIHKTDIIRTDNNTAVILGLRSPDDGTLISPSRNNGTWHSAPDFSTMKGQPNRLMFRFGIRFMD